MIAHDLLILLLCRALLDPPSPFHSLAVLPKQSGVLLISVCDAAIVCLLWASAEFAC